MLKGISTKEGQLMLYRKTSFLYGIIFCSSFALIVLHRIIHVSLWVGLLIGIAIFACGTLLCEFLAINISVKLNRVLFMDLNPELFIQKMTHEMCSKNPADWRLPTVILISQAHQAMGRFKEAEEMLIVYLNNLPNNKTGDVAKKDEIIALSRLVTIYSDAGNQQAVINAYEKLEQRLLGFTLDEGTKNFVVTAYNCFLLSTGKYSECLDYFEKESNKNSGNLRYISMSFRLAEAYSACGEADKARPLYQRVAEHGKMLFLAEKSAQHLSE